MCTVFSVDILCVWKCEKVCQKKKTKLHDDKHQLLQQMISAMHRSVARIIFWLHDHMPWAHNIHVTYNFEHHSSRVAAEWGVCIVIADVRHTVQNACFSTSVQKLLTLLFSPFTQTCLTIWPSKKYKSHTNIKKKNQTLLSTFLAHLLALSDLVTCCIHTQGYNIISLSASESVSHPFWQE